MLYLSPFHKSMLEMLESGIQRVDEQDYSIIENEDALTIELQMPGFDKEKISIIRTGKELSISAETERRGKKHQVDRTFIIADKYDLENIDAEYKDGILSVTAKKKETFKTRRIQIK